MAEVASKDFYCGDVVTIIATNRPYTDITVQSQINDYRWADTANIKIYTEKQELVVNADMCRSDKTGWYIYRYPSSCDCGMTGVFRVEITMTTVITDCSSPATSGTPETTGSSGTPGTTGTSGSPSGTMECSDVAVYYFRINPRR